MLLYTYWFKICLHTHIGSHIYVKKQLPLFYFNCANPLSPLSYTFYTDGKTLPPRCKIIFERPLMPHHLGLPSLQYHLTQRDWGRLHLDLDSIYCLISVEKMGDHKNKLFTAYNQSFSILFMLNFD